MKYDKVLWHEDQLNKINKEIDEWLAQSEKLNLRRKEVEQKISDIIFAEILKGMKHFDEECHLNFTSEHTLSIIFHNIKRNYRKLLKLHIEIVKNRYINKETGLWFSIQKNSDQTTSISISGFENESKIREFIGFFLPNMSFIDKIKLGVVESEYK